MGCSQSLVEHTLYFHSGELFEHYYIFNGKCCELNTQYRRNGTITQIYNYNNNRPYGPFMSFFKDGTLKIYGHYINSALCEYKEYDRFGSLVQYNVVNLYHSNSKNVIKYCANFINNKLCAYVIEYRFAHTFHIIYNTTNTSDIIVNSSIINGIRQLQKCFRKRKYTPIINILNTVIGVQAPLWVPRKQRRRFLKKRI